MLTDKVLLTLQTYDLDGDNYVGFLINLWGIVGLKNSQMYLQIMFYVNCKIMQNRSMYIQYVCMDKYI